MLASKWKCIRQLAARLNGSDSQTPQKKKTLVKHKVKAMWQVQRIEVAHVANAASRSMQMPKAILMQMRINAQWSPLCPISLPLLLLLLLLLP